MGMKFNSGHFHKTNGAKKNLKFAIDLQFFASLPNNDDQLKHIFRDVDGHLTDNPVNRSMLVELSTDKEHFLGCDRFGLEWYAKNIDEGQLWVSVKNGVIQNGGLNKVPIKYINNVGLKKNIIWRKK